VLNRISLQAGATTEATGLDFIPGSVTVFVGPNNSGKSLVLREIELLVREGGVAVPGRYKVVASIAARAFDPVEMEALV
jgi:ABC-type hemin transport system ATPase subunit